MGRVLIIGVLLIYSLSGCHKQELPIPYVPVDTSININLPSYSALNSVGGVVFINGGSRGIVVYRVSFDSWVAFDRHGTYNAGEPCDPVARDTSNSFLLNDPCSASQWSILDGSVVTGPATQGLVPYNVTYDGFSTLRIWN